MNAEINQFELQPYPAKFSNLIGS